MKLFQRRTAAIVPAGRLFSAEQSKKNETKQRKKNAKENRAARKGAGPTAGRHEATGHMALEFHYA